LIIKQAEAAAAPSGGNFSNLFGSYVGQVYGDKYTQDAAKRIKDKGTEAEQKRFDRNQRILQNIALGAGGLSAATNFARNLADVKFRPISSLGAGQAAYQGVKGTLGPIVAGLDERLVDVNRRRSPRSGYPVASSTYREPAAEFRTVDPTMLSEQRQINPIRTPSPKEQSLVGVTPEQSVFTRRFAGGPVKVKPKAEPTPQMTEEQVKVLAPTAPPSPTQNNLKQFTEKDMVKIINRDDAEDAEEEKRLNAKNIDGSKQIQGNV